MEQDVRIVRASDGSVGLRCVLVCACVIRACACEGKLSIEEFSVWEKQIHTP